MKKILILILIMICCSGCPVDTFYSIQITNNSDRKIVGYVGMDSNDISVYPNISIPIDKNTLYYFNDRANYIFWDSRKSRKEIFRNSDTISVFIFSVDTLNKYSWEQIRQDYNILIRYDLSYQDIDYLRHNVTYPPSANMSHMKMYPPYPGK